MIHINISLPDELHTDLKLAAALRGTRLKDYIAQTLKEQASAPAPSKKS